MEAKDATAYRYPRYQTISATYFEALGIPIVQGRGVSPGGRPERGNCQPLVRLGNGSGRRNPVGQTLVVHGWKPDLKNSAVIVGVVADSLLSPWQIEGRGAAVFTCRTLGRRKKPRAICAPSD